MKIIHISMQIDLGTPLGLLGAPWCEKGCRVSLKTPPQGSPKGIQNWPKITKNNEKLESFFRWFSNIPFWNGLPPKRYPNGTQIHPKSTKSVRNAKNCGFMKMWLFLRRQHDFQGSDVPKSIQKSQKMHPEATSALATHFRINFHQI